MGAAAVLVAGCFGTKDTNTTDTNDTNTEEVALETTQAALGSEVTVQYVGRLAGGEDVAVADIIADCETYEVFDTSHEELAQACGIAADQRDYTQPLAFVAGAQQLIPGFENSVIDKEAGDSYTITIPAAQAYGEWSEDNIVAVPVDQLPPKMSETDSGATVDYVEGDEIVTPLGPIQVVAVDAEANTVSVDANHPLAGEDLIFDIEIIDVQAPTAASLEAIEQAQQEAADVVVETPEMEEETEAADVATGDAE